MRIFFENEETIRQGKVLLQIVALGYPFYGAFIMLEQVHLGVGLNTPFMIISIVHSWLLQVVPALIVTQALGFSETAVWWVLTISGIATTIAFYYYYQRGRWLTVKV
jgi:Na+-driven multidrug efflux pump